MPDGTSIFGAFRDWSPHGKCRLVGGAVPEGPSQVFVLFREGVADKALANFSSGAAMTWINESRRPVLRQDDPMNAAAHADAGMFVISYPDGSSFEGAVMRGRPVGGTVTMPLDEDGKALAAKSFAKRDSVVAAGALGPAGTLEGPGTFVNLEGCVFRGVWSHGTLTNGRLEYIDGSIYDGDFDDDGVPHGAGSYALPNGADKWVGEFKKGMFVKGHLADKVSCSVSHLLVNVYVKVSMHGCYDVVLVSACTCVSIHVCFWVSLLYIHPVGMWCRGHRPTLL